MPLNFSLNCRQEEDPNAGKKQKKFKTSELNEPVDGASNVDANTPADETPMKEANEPQTGKKRKNKQTKTTQEPENGTRPRKDSVGEQPEPVKKKLKLTTEGQSNANASDQPQQNQQPAGDKKKKKKKKKKKPAAQQAAASTSNNSGPKKNNKPANKKPATSSSNPIVNMSDDRLKAYGIKNPKRFKNAVIFGKGQKS